MLFQLGCRSEQHFRRRSNEKASILKSSLALVVITLFTSCGFVPKRETAPDPGDGNNGESNAADFTPEDDPEEEPQQDDSDSDGNGAYSSLGNGSFLVNVDELKTITDADSFPIIIEGSRTVESAFFGYTYESNDAISISACNKTDKTNDKVTVDFCCYDSGNHYAEIDSGGTVYAQQTIFSAFEWSDLALASGESKEIAARLKTLKRFPAFRRS